MGAQGAASGSNSIACFEKWPMRMLLLKIAFNVVLASALIMLARSPSVGLTTDEDMKLKIERLINGSGGATVAVALHDIESGKELLINSEISFHPASTMKVPVMMEVYRQAAEGKLTLEDKIPVKNDFI